MLELLFVKAPIALWLPVFLALEHFVPKQKGSVLTRFPGALLLLLTPAFAAILSVPMQWLWSKAGILPLVSLTSLHPALQLLLLLLIHDFLRYLEHRVEHRVWWPVHSVHHSETDLHASNSFAHPLIALPEFVMVSVPLSLLSYSPGPMMLMIMISAGQNLLIHSPIRIHAGPFRRIFVDSRFHRIHHSMEERHFGKNFGYLFSFWDQLLGTAYFPARDEWPDTGVQGLTPPRTLRTYLFPQQIRAVFRRAAPGTGVPRNRL